MRGDASAVVALAMVVSQFAPATAGAADFPTKPITLIVSLAPGGVADIIARSVGRRLSDEWGQPVIVENRPGANTQVGVSAVAKSPADGHTLLVTPEYTFTVNPYLYHNQRHEGLKELTPVSGLATAPLALVVNPAVPAQDVKGLIAWAKSNPGKLNAAVPGIGSISHLSMELLQSRAGVKFSSVSYRGAAPAMVDIIANHTQAMFVAIGLVAQSANAGQLRILGVGQATRLSQFPNVPSISEAIPGFEASLWFGLFAPRGTPGEVITKLNTAVQRILGEQEFNDKVMKANSFEKLSGTPDALTKIIETDSKRWSDTIRDAGISAPE